ncbi:cupin domain-containing protein [Salinigranum salinum]|uniref:cupin domain-containing protein n=1 Tax=Salinigranum salinum TaxID=1364937 RepID=UPI0012609101|nr:cupin domain-containing protein [Salinigranum salinum]
MSYTKVNYHDVDPKAEAMYFLRDPLGCENLGLTVVDCEPNWTGMEHDHADRRHEEVYYLVEGEATLHVDGDEVAMDAGDAVRVSPDATRQIENGPRASTFVVVGAP